MPHKKKRQRGNQGTQAKRGNANIVREQYRQELDGLLQQSASIDEEGLNHFLNKHEIACVQGHYKEAIEQSHETHFFRHIHCITASDMNAFMTVFEHYSKHGCLHSNETTERLDQMINMRVDRGGNTFLMELLHNEQWDAVKQWLAACQKYQVGLDIRKCDDKGRTVLELAMMMDTVPTDILENLICLYPGIDEISAKLLEQEQWDICGPEGERISEEMPSEIAKCMEVAYKQNNHAFLGFMQQNYPGLYNAHTSDLAVRSIQQNTVREYCGMLRSVGIDPERDEKAQSNEIRLLNQSQRNIGLLQASGRKAGSCTMIELLIGISSGPIKIQFSANGEQIDLSDQDISRNELINLKWTANNLRALIGMLENHRLAREYSGVVDGIRDSLIAEQKKLTGYSKRKKYIENSVKTARGASACEGVDLPVRTVGQRNEREELCVGLSGALGFFSEGKAASENLRGKVGAFQGHGQTGSEDLEDWLVVEPPR